MNRLAGLYELTIFEAVHAERQVAGQAGWWSVAPQSKSIPYAFSHTIMLTVDGTLLLQQG